MELWGIVQLVLVRLTLRFCEVDVFFVGFEIRWVWLGEILHPNQWFDSNNWLLPRKLTACPLKNGGGAGFLNHQRYHVIKHQLVY